MNTRFGLLCAAAVVMLAGTANAQLGGGTVVVEALKITKVNYTAAGNGQPPKADPEGTWSKPADGVDWRVIWDYEVKENGKWKPLAVAGGSKPLLGADTSGTWGPIGAENLPNPLPTMVRVRAVLQRHENSMWADKKTDYKEFP